MKLPFSHHIGTSSPVVSKGGTSENTGSSLLDLTDTKYRDFDVSLDSSYLLPSTKTSVLKRLPTPPPPRTKHKRVTFALPLEEAGDKLSEILDAPVEAIAPAIWKETDELERLKLEFEPPRGNESPSSVDRFLCLGSQLTTKPHAFLPSPTFSPWVGKAAVPRPESSSQFALRRNRSRPRLSEVTLSMAADSKNRHSARDTLLSPAVDEPAARRDYLAPIMVVRSQNLARFYLSSSTASLSRF